MAEPAQVMATLDALATELGTRSAELADVERQLEPVEIDYEDFVEAFVAGMFESHEGRLPGEDVRRSLAHQRLREERPELLGRYRKLTRSRKRLQARIDTVSKAVGAQRSILSALKVEMEATH